LPGIRLGYWNQARPTAAADSGAATDPRASVSRAMSSRV
jgi:hypothetical protein